MSKAGRNVRRRHAGRKRSAVATCVAYIRHRGVEAVFEIPSESGEKSGGAQTTTWTVTKGGCFSLQHTPRATATTTTAHIGRWMDVGTRTSVEEPVSSQGRPGTLNQLHRTQRRRRGTGRDHHSVDRAARYDATTTTRTAEEPDPRGIITTVLVVV